MTRKDFEAMAAMLATQRDSVSHKFAGKGTGLEYVVAMSTLDTITTTLADLFAADNPRFNRERFLNASGYND